MAKHHIPQRKGVARGLFSRAPARSLRSSRPSHRTHQSARGCGLGAWLVILLVPVFGPRCSCRLNRQYEAESTELEQGRPRRGRGLRSCAACRPPCSSTELESCGARHPVRPAPLTTPDEVARRSCRDHLEHARSLPRNGAGSGSRAFPRAGRLPTDRRIARAVLEIGPSASVTASPKSACWVPRREYRRRLAPAAPRPDVRQHRPRRSQAAAHSQRDLRPVSRWGSDRSDP